MRKRNRRSSTPRGDIPSHTSGYPQENELQATPTRPPPGRIQRRSQRETARVLSPNPHAERQNRLGIQQERNDDQGPLTGLDEKMLEHAFLIYTRHFPEFDFFHHPSFLTRLDEKAVPTLLLCALLALSSRFMPEVVSLHGGPAKASRHFADYVRRNIIDHTTGPMDIHISQALLMLSLYDWGEGNSSHAWIHNGMSTRIAHGAYARCKSLSERRPANFRNSQLEEACRTVWACFLIDVMIGCGKCQASNHSLSIRGIPLPWGEDDFAFDIDSSSAVMFLDLWDPEIEPHGPLRSSSPGKMGSDQSLTLMIQGFHIWHTISTWVSTGGRKRESLASREPPWRDTSFWARSMAALKNWRASQHPNQLYSPSNMNIRVYISRGEGERFAVINLVYYLSVIFLHREYLPFAPQSINRHQGPIDPPLLSEAAPAGWWEQAAHDLFSVALSIVRIMQELDQRGLHFQTPFTCFCIFNAATTLLYAVQWPHMAVGLDSELSSLLSWSFAWLNRACKVWRLACGWYRTLQTLVQLYRQISVDPTHLVHAQHELLPTLQDNIQRLAGLENTDIPSANILLLLQRQQEQLCTSSDSRATNVNQVPSRAQGSDSFIAEDPGTQVDSDIPPHISSFQLDQDLFSNILADSSGDWLRPFVDPPFFLGDSSA